MTESALPLLLLLEVYYVHDDLYLTAATFFFHQGENNPIMPGRGGDSSGGRGGAGAGKSRGRGGARGRGGGRGAGRGGPKQKWEKWQLDLTLPDVAPGSNFGSLEFACFNCGTTLIHPGEIQRFGDPHPESTTNAVWTNVVPNTLVVNKEWEWNPVKECNVKNTYCKRCLGNRVPGDPTAFTVGSTYDEDFSNEELRIKGTTLFPPPQPKSAAGRQPIHYFSPP